MPGLWVSGRQVILKPRNRGGGTMRYQPKPSATNDNTDRVYTPEAWASTIMRLLPLSGLVLDPARGHGAFYDLIPDDCEALWCEVDEGRDFFAFEEKVDWVVTNPPWSKIKDFLQHSFEIADNVVFLITTNHAYTKARVAVAREGGFGMRGILHMPTPPKPWPSATIRLTCCWTRVGVPRTSRC